MLSPFPTVHWGGSVATFHAPASPATLGGNLFASVVFAFQGRQVAVADIRGRGWCVPSGRIEPGETPEQAAVREAWEEAGLVLQPLTPLGEFLLSEPSGATRRVPSFVARIRRFEAIPAQSESDGVRLVDLAELPQLYYQWDDLLDAVFAYALFHSEDGELGSIG